MKKNHFIMPYFGNKRNEVKEIYEKISPIIDDIKTIIEPFCGSCALSFYISTLHPKKFHYILNDNNKFLIDLLEIIKDDDKLKILCDKLNEFSKDLTKEKYTEIIKNHKTDIYSWFYGNTVFNIRPYLYPQGRTIKNDFQKIFLNHPFINFLKTENITLKCIDAKDIIIEYKDDIKCLLFLDPPYLMSSNDFYNNKDVNIYEWLCNNNLNDFKSKFLLCLEDVWIIKLLFEKNIKSSYSKTYQTTKKKN